MILTAKPYQLNATFLPKRHTHDQQMTRLCNSATGVFRQGQLWVFRRATYSVSEKPRYFWAQFHVLFA